MDETHDASRQSWVESANDAASDFPIQNLPFGVFESGGDSRVAVAIGRQALDLAGCRDAGLLDGAPVPALEALGASWLNALMARPAAERTALRRVVSRLLARESGDAARAARHLVKQDGVRWLVPASIGDYTDFYASVHHATNVGRLFRPDNPLLPNYKFVPIGYHGRASSIVVGGTPVRRPCGQTRAGTEAPPSFGPARRLDYELEVGVFVGPGNALGVPIPIDDAEQHAFGLCLLNDWSARDVQQWEYQPLGPFLAKSFATSISPFVVTLDALAPFRAPAFARPEGDPAPLPYLSSPSDLAAGGIDALLEVRVSSQQMRERGLESVLVSRSRLATLYWTFAQMLAHHASNGCNLRPGDLIASGTVSGPGEDSRGCLLERTVGGTRPLDLPTGERRTFLEDGDEVILRGWCEREGFRRIGFGECRGVVLPAH